jgi:hypothetical protein
VADPSGESAASLYCSLTWCSRSRTCWLGGPIAVAAASVIVPVLYWRDFWGRISFWVATLLVTAIQVPLVIGMRPLIQQARMFYMAVFLVSDFFFVAL